MSLFTGVPGFLAGYVLPGAINLSFFAGVPGFLLSCGLRWKGEFVAICRGAGIFGDVGKPNLSLFARVPAFLAMLES